MPSSPSAAKASSSAAADGSSSFAWAALPSSKAAIASPASIPVFMTAFPDPRFVLPGEPGWSLQFQENGRPA
ncbi:MAG: hypothetical protein BroJett029_41060 [Alphaproteobacteria bacterium]|nr:MAG: hypothetical protein BroJett029_41060 [Alphaproteobacteria bacterium]